MNHFTLASRIAFFATSVLLLASCAAQSPSTSHQDREPMAEPSQLHFVDTSTSPLTPPQLTHEGIQLNASLVDWSNQVGGETYEEATAEQIINTIQVSEKELILTFELSTGAELLAAELSFYPPGSTSEDFNEAPSLRMDCLSDQDCAINYHNNTTEITISSSAWAAPGAFVGLYVEYPAQHRSDGGFFNSEAWAIHIEG